MSVRIAQAFDKVSFWTPVKYKDQAACWQHRLIQWIDAYFDLGGVVAIVAPGIKNNQSSGVKLKEETQPQWLTILKVVSYATLILPAIVLLTKWALRSLYSFHICSRALPNETVETGTFANNILQQGVRVHVEKTEEMIFVNPTLLIPEDYIEIMESEGAYVNIAEVMLDGKVQLVAVRRLNEQGEYIRCKAPTPQILLEFAKMEIGRDNPRLQPIFDNPHQGELPKDFFALILAPNDKGNVPICAEILDSHVLLNILKYAQKNHIVIDPRNICDLYKKWVGKGNAELTQTLLALHPQAIRKEGARNSFYFAAIAGSEGELPHILEAMRTQNIDFSCPFHRWIYKAYINDCAFTKEDFLALPKHQQDIIFKTANQFMRKEFLLKLRGIRGKENVLLPTDIDLFSPNMDAIDVTERTYSFLKDLRAVGALVTEQEFAAVSENYVIKKYTPTLNKSFLLPEIINRKAKQLHLDFVKTPRHIAVIRPQDKTSPHLNVRINHLNGHKMGLSSEDIPTYVEKITPINHHLTQAEMTALLDMLEALRFWIPSKKSSFLYGKNTDGVEGLYFMDSWAYPFSEDFDYDKMHILAELMAPENHEWLKQELHRRSLLFQQNPTPLEPLLLSKEVDRQQAEKHGFAIPRNMQVPIANIPPSV